MDVKGKRQAIRPSHDSPHGPNHDLGGRQPWADRDYEERR